MKAAATRKTAARRGAAKRAPVKKTPVKNTSVKSALSKNALAKTASGKNRPGQKAGGARTRRERLEGRESAIVGAAYALFAAQGFAKTTMSDIAAEARVAEGTLYLYFSNKNALARAVLAAFYEKLTVSAGEGAARRRTTASRLEFLARHHLESIIKERRLLELISSADRNPETYEGSALYKMNRAYVAVFDGVVRDARARGELAAEPSLWLLRDVFFGGLEYAMRTILMRGRANGEDADRAVAGIVSLLVAKRGEALRNDVSGEGGDLHAAADRLEAAAARLERLADSGEATSGRKAKRHGG